MSNLRLLGLTADSAVQAVGLGQIEPIHRLVRELAGLAVSGTAFRAEMLLRHLAALFRT
jgi:hypothetical protein